MAARGGTKASHGATSTATGCSAHPQKLAALGHPGPEEHPFAPLSALASLKCSLGGLLRQSPADKQWCYDVLTKWQC